MKQSDPIKRSDQLAPLSREHHEALVFLLHIKQGLKNGTPTILISQYVTWFWENHLNNHFRQEEKLLLPHFAEDDALAIQLKAEHNTIRQLASGELDEPGIIHFSNILNGHIRFEERQLFPQIEKRMSTDQLNNIFEQLNEPVQCQTSWPNKFWSIK